MSAALQSEHITVPSAQPKPKDFWRAFGFVPEGDDIMGLNCTVPPGVVVFSADIEKKEALVDVVKAIGVPTLTLHADKRRWDLYRVENAFDIGSAIVPDGVMLNGVGDTISLPHNKDFTPEKYEIGKLTELPLLTLDDLARGIEIKGYTPVVDTPLAKHSLRGRSEEFELMAVKAEPLLGQIAMTGQATVLYAPPNAGKTLMVLSLLTEAVEQRRINPGNVYYINADDNSEGLATKLGLLDDLGANMLVPGHLGFETAQLVEKFHAIADTNKAKGTLVIIDTIKKATSLMDKGSVTEFTSACRKFVMKGGAIVGLAHTNKTPSASGKLQYSGTTDLKDDFDAAYIITPIEPEGFDGEKVVSFECIKNRGPNVREVAYAYADAADATYVERLASVRLVDAKELDGFRRTVTEKTDADIITEIEACIRQGEFAKMALAKEAAKRSGASNRAAMRIIEAYTGTDPETHKWTFVRKDRGAMIYMLLSGPEEEPEPLAA